MLTSTFDRKTTYGLLLGAVAVVLIIAGYALMQRIMFHRWQLWYQLQRGNNTTQAFILSRENDDLPEVTYRFIHDDADYFYTEVVDDDLWEDLEPGSVIDIRYAFDGSGRLYSQLDGNRSYITFFTLVTLLFWGGVAWLVYRAFALILTVDSAESQGET